MNARITPRRFSGLIKIPASKSHTIRQLLIASLADGISEIKNPLDSLDTRSCLSVCRAFGAEIENRDQGTGIRIEGNNGFKKPLREPPRINVGNSGTTLFFALAIAGLQSEWLEFTGDEQIQKRSAAPLLDALAGLGIQCKNDNGFIPISIKGPWKGGKVILPCPTSQYLSALLIASPLAPAGTTTEIEVPLLNEKPYVEMTLSYIKNNLVTNIKDVCHQHIPFEYSPDYSNFVIPGGSSYKAFSASVPGDFSSAAFPAAAAAISGGQVTLLGLDPQDTQGDKYFFEILKSMGCEIQYSEKDGSFTVSRSGSLRSGTFDLNETPDLFPAAAAVAAFAEGDTALVNVTHARIKETDRIAVMAKELTKLGVSCTEHSDGLVIHGKGSGSVGNKSCIIDGHGDHRIVMAFAAAAHGCQNSIEITNAESAAVTYPGFWELFGAEV